MGTEKEQEKKKKKGKSEGRIRKRAAGKEKIVPKVGSGEQRWKKTCTRLDCGPLLGLKLFRNTEYLVRENTYARDALQIPNAKSKSTWGQNFKECNSSGSELSRREE